MSTHPTRHRIKFSELALGQRFYDPISAEYFVKQSDTMAAMVTGIGDGTIPDEFEADGDQPSCTRPLASCRVLSSSLAQA
jgi:hypothetical protein